MVAGLVAIGGASAAAGDLDTSFGTGGSVVTSLGSTNFGIGEGVALQADGKILMAGIDGLNYNQDQNFAVARYNSDGSLDGAFANGGVATTDFGTATDEGRAVAVQGDGKIVLAGITQKTPGHDELAVARYNTDGTIDTSFANNGLLQFSDPAALPGGSGDEINAVAVQPDGKLLVAGDQQQSDGLRFFVARLNDDGSFDPSFGTDGEATASFGAGWTSAAYSIQIDSSGRIVLAGFAYNYPNYADFALARFNGDGTLDQSFDSTGTETIDVGGPNSPDQGYAAVIQSDGKIVEVGQSGSGFGLVRVNPDGSLDATFGNGGIVINDFSSLGASFQTLASSVALQGDKLVVGGWGWTTNDEFVVARFNGDGALDTTFGQGGVVHAQIGASNDFVAGVVIQGDGNIVAGGYATPASGGYSFALARFLGSGAAADTTAPVVTGTPARPPDANGWYRSPVTIHWTATDADDPSVPAPPDTVASTDGANVSYTSDQSCDPAGNCATGTFSLSLDEHPPGDNCATPDGLWHANDVSIACSASDSLSGLANSADAGFSLATSVPAGTETANASTGSHQVCDLAGNCVTAGPVAGNKVDKKPPQITLTTPAVGTVYTYKQPVTASFSCVDGGSGTASPGSCTGTPVSGSNVSTTTPGANTFTVTSQDAVGNTAPSVSHAYSVHFAFGFAAPLKNQPANINVVQSGKGVPVPFTLRDYAGTSIYGTFGLAVLAGNSPTSAVITCPTATKNNVSQTTTSSGLRYISSAGQYEYDWPTSTAWKGTCRTLTFKFKDGTSQTVNFQFK